MHLHANCMDGSFAVEAVRRRKFFGAVSSVCRAITVRPRIDDGFINVIRVSAKMRFALTGAKRAVPRSGWSTSDHDSRTPVTRQRLNDLDNMSAS